MRSLSGYASLDTGGARQSALGELNYIVKNVCMSLFGKYQFLRIFRGKCKVFAMFPKYTIYKIIAGAIPVPPFQFFSENKLKSSQDKPSHGPHCNCFR